MAMNIKQTIPVQNTTVTKVHQNLNQNVSQPNQQGIGKNATLSLIEKIRKEWDYLGSGLFIKKNSGSYQLLDIPRKLPFKMVNMTIDDPFYDIPKYFPEITDFVSVNLVDNKPLIVTKPTKIAFSCSNRDEMVGVLSFSDSDAMQRISINVSSPSLEIMVFPLDIYTKKSLTTSYSTIAGKNVFSKTTTDQDILHYIPSSNEVEITPSKSLTTNATVYMQSVDETDLVKNGFNLQDVYTLWATIDSAKLV